MLRLPGPYIALASQVAGEITEVADCSWERDSSAVWRLASASGGCWYLKRHSSWHDCASRLVWLGPHIPAVASHGDFQPRNWLWDPASTRLGVIDWERAEPAAAIRDLVRLEYGPWDRRPDLREQFFAG